MQQADLVARSEPESAQAPNRAFRVRSPGPRLEFEFLQRRLYTASTIIFGVTVLLTLMQLLLGGARTGSVMAAAALCLAAAIAGRIAHARRKPRLGWWLVIGLLIGAITWNIVFHGGIDVPAIIQYVVLVSVGIRILGARSGMIAAAACLIALAAAAGAHTTGVLPESGLAQLPWKHALTGAITVALLAELMWYASRQDTLQSEARERLEEFARASGGWFWETDAGGRLHWVSEGAPPALRVSLESLIGKALWELDDTGAASATLRETVGRGELIRAFYVLRRNADGQHRRFELSGLPTLAADGQVQGYRGVALPASAGSA